MTLGLPLSSEVWRFFLEDIDEAVVQRFELGSVQDWEWLWLKQVAALPKEGLNLTNPYKPIIKFNLRCEEYWIEMSPDPGSSFPSKPPTVRCAYQQGFYFDWCSDEKNGSQISTLTDILKSYLEYCGAIDIAISEIKLIQSDFITLLGFSLSDEDTECFVVQFRPKSNADETITIHVDWRNPYDFPRHMSSTDEERFLSLDCDMWDVNENLCWNLEKIIKEEQHSEFCLN
ncbi:hypothetical protein KIN20_033695 [Parelaphostrongylus tenuis]|uniref:Uncharacterized protein n=1 Tax=Parelaphostrongylus tenuis TaxID=148309 RepID=A0AAD5WIN0_PARTN|nr:hypothetical protein KIN20_033695 [Parelaphostrongylus tenuis]